MAKVVKEEDLEPVIKEITITVARTFNMGNYESLRIEASAAASTEIGAGRYMPVDQAVDKLLPHVRRALQRAYDDHVDGKGRLNPL